jgi:hypothetical protein
MEMEEAENNVKQVKKVAIVRIHAAANSGASAEAANAVNAVNTGKSLSINIGDGKQTIRWLSTVVASRAKESKLVLTDFPENNFIVTGVRNVEGTLINPADAICEHMSGSDPDRITLIVDLLSTFPSDEWGNPKLTNWQVNAFVHSKPGIKWAVETEAWRERNRAGGEEEYEEEQGAAEALSSRDDYNFVQIGSNFTAADVEMAFSLDVKQIKCSWLPSSSSSVDMMESLAGIAKASYDVICNVYAHYCGVGEGEHKA